MNQPTAELRKFVSLPARRKDLPLLLGFYGPSGSGKTLSAMRAATGIQRVVGGKIYVIDTESGRALQYAPLEGQKAEPPFTFDFVHVPMGDPFGPLDYHAAIAHCVEDSGGRGVIVVDSASHEHEGIGGVLEQHAAEHQRLGGKEGTKMLAWGVPKRSRRVLINSVTTTLPRTMATIWCFRAKPKLNLDGPLDAKRKKTVVKLGWMPIGGDEFLFEMTVRALFYPGCNGVPQWAPTMPGEKEVVRVPRQFRELLNARTAHAMCEEDGESMMRWQMGQDAPTEAKQPLCLGNGEWKGKPLAELPTPKLIDYKTAIAKLRDSSTGSQRARWSAHIEEIDSDIERRVRLERPINEGVPVDDEDDEATDEQRQDIAS